MRIKALLVLFFIVLTPGCVGRSGLVGIGAGTTLIVGGAIMDSQGDSGGFYGSGGDLVVLSGALVVIGTTLIGVPLGVALESHSSGSPTGRSGTKSKRCRPPATCSSPAGQSP